MFLCFGSLSFGASFPPSLSVHAPRAHVKTTRTLAPLGKATTAADVAAQFSADLTGKVAVVTGGNSGIGLETVRVLAAQGCRVILCSRSVEQGRIAVASLPPSCTSRVSVQPLDLSDLKSVETAAAAILKKVAL